MPKNLHFSGEIWLCGLFLHNHVDGFVIYRLLMQVDTPVGNTLPDMVITVVLCVVVEKIAEAVKSK